jgi:AcrR family transcriptional regulator
VHLRRKLVKEPEVPKLSSGTTTRRPRLTKARVLEAALQLADESGIEALTMRRLGERLGVEAMSLYNHFPSKEAILDGIVDLVIGEIELPDSGGEWETGVRRCALSAYEVLLRHPWACRLVMIPPSTGALNSRIDYIESLLRQFRQAGFSPELTYRAYHAVDSHVLGFTMWELGHNLPASVDPALVEEMFAVVSTGEFPYLLEHAKQHFEDRSEEQSGFEFGLDLVLDGLKRRQAAETPAVSQRGRKH